MIIEPDSVHARILRRLWAMPRSVRSVSAVMLRREFDAAEAILDLAEAGLIRSRGWNDLEGRVPNGIWVLTPAGEALCESMLSSNVKRLG